MSFWPKRNRHLIGICTNLFTLYPISQHVTYTGIESYNTKITKLRPTILNITYINKKKKKRGYTCHHWSTNDTTRKKVKQLCMIEDPSRLVAQLTSSGEVNRCFKTWSPSLIPHIGRFLSTLSKYVSNNCSNAI